VILDVEVWEDSGSGLSGEGCNICFAEFGRNAVIFEEEGQGVPDWDVPVAALIVVGSNGTSCGGDGARCGDCCQS
jgi:hypothetical protein